MKKILVILRKSVIGRSKRQVACVRGLGLTTRISSSRVIQDTPENRGMIVKVHMLVEVQEVPDETGS
jgi:large subunit ribosomal protein L30